LVYFGASKTSEGSQKISLLTPQTESS